VEAYSISTQHLAAQLSNDLTIDGYDTCLDELVGLTTAANTGIGQKLVQTNGLVGIKMFLLVFYTLLQAILGIGVVATGALLTETATLLAVATTLVTTLLTIATLTLVTALTRLTITALTLVTALLTGLAITALTLVTALLTRLAITTLLTGLITFLTRLITLLALSLLIKVGTIALLTRLIAALTGLITLLTRLITLLTILCTRTEAALRGTALQTGTETLRTETTFLLILIAIITTLRSHLRTRLLNTRTW
jgi:hypothetical protein